MNFIKTIIPERFEKYGYVIQYKPGTDTDFQVILKEESRVGWRIAVSRIKAKKITNLARHPDSMECFEPLTGITLLCVALADSPVDYDVFLLDRQVCIKENIWHAMVCLSEYSMVKIFENAEVSSEEYKLVEPIKF